MALWNESLGASLDSLLVFRTFFVPRSRQDVRKSFSNVKGYYGAHIYVTNDKNIKFTFSYRSTRQPPVPRAGHPSPTPPSRPSRPVPGVPSRPDSAPSVPR